MSWNLYRERIRLNTWLLKFKNPEYDSDDSANEKRNGFDFVGLTKKTKKRKRDTFEKQQLSVDEVIEQLFQMIQN